jgi:elongation factor P
MPSARSTLIFLGGTVTLISTADFKNGISLLLDGQVYTIVEFQHVKPGKGGAFVRTKLKNLKNGNTIEKTFRSGEKMEQAILDRRNMQYLYSTGDAHVFMDQETSSKPKSRTINWDPRRNI